MLRERKKGSSRGGIWQFSVRQLIVVATMIAVAIVLVANDPFLTAVFLLFIGPLLVRIGATPFTRLRAPGHVHWIVAVLQATFMFACVICLFQYLASYGRDWRTYVWLGLVSGVAIVFGCLAWAQSDAISASNVTRDESISSGDDPPAI